MITQETVRSLLYYDRDTGIFRWKERKRRGGRGGFNITDGTIAGAVSARYRIIRILDRNYAAHKIAWLYVHGNMPEYVDHINRNSLDDRISNLRVATYQQNNRNRSKNKSLLHKGIDFHKGRWCARICINKKSYHIGYFELKEAAIRAYDARALALFGEFAATNEDMVA